MSHYKMVASETAPGEPEQKRIRLDKKLFFRKLKNWIYALVVSLLPFILVFFLHIGPPKNFAFLEFFGDNALFYVGVTMSAVALYSYRMTSGVRFIHTVMLLIGMAVYYSLAGGNSIPLFNSGYDKRVFIAVFLLFSIVAGLVTLFISSRRREK